MVARTETISKTCDVIVIGGGPAGATAATLVAQQGHSVQLFERDPKPSFQVGESLMPETYWTFRRLGLLEKLQGSCFTKKFSVQFVSDSGKESQPFYFFDNNPHECSQTWQVVREDFDDMMIQNARDQGAKVHMGVRVLDVLFDGDRATGVKVRSPDGREEEITSKVVIDATGQSSIIANRLKLREADPVLKNASVWTYFKGAHRDPGLDEGATLVLQLNGKLGWFWYIPLPNDIVSVGVVSTLEYLFKGRGADHGKIFAEEVENCPAVKKRIEDSERITQHYGTKDFSYRSKQVAGQGWVLVGDAFGFLDPVYSSGVFLALKSGEWAADAVNEGLAANDFSAQQLGKWGPEFTKGMDRVKRLVYAFYNGFSFGQFLRRYPEYKRHITDLLIGDIFKDQVDEVFGPMDEMQNEMTAMSGSKA